MRINFTSGGTAGGTIDQASGENDGPGTGFIVAVLVAAYAAYKVLM